MFLLLLQSFAHFYSKFVSNQFKYFVIEQLNKKTKFDFFFLNKTIECNKNELGGVMQRYFDELFLFFGND
jgi:hypothetical protein